MKYIKELVLLFIQIIFVYLLPIFAGPTDIMGLVILLMFITYLTSLFMGILSDKKIKYLYPIIVCIIFVPSFIIFSNKLVVGYSLYFFITSIIGLLVGLLVKKIFKKI